MTKPNIGIISLGHHLPETILNNQHFVNRGLDTNDDWIKSRSGISTRHIKKHNEKTSDLATKAAKNAIKKSNITKEQIDFIIVATATPDHAGFPSTACIVQQKLNIKRNIPSFDISAACSGFVYALSIGHNKILANQGQYGLIIGAESLSDILDWSDRKTCILFGDGAGAAIIGHVTSGGFNIFIEGADGHQNNILKTEKKINTETVNKKSLPFPKDIISMDGQAVFKQGIQRIENCIHTLISSKKVNINNITYFVPHQANIRIIEFIAKKFKIPIKRFLTNIARVGNTSAASIPIVLSENSKTNKFKKGDTIFLIGFGAGFTWSSILLEW